MFSVCRWLQKTEASKTSCAFFVAASAFALAKLEVSDQPPQLLRGEFLIEAEVEVSHLFIRDGVLIQAVIPIVLEYAVRSFFIARFADPVDGTLFSVHPVLLSTYRCPQIMVPYGLLASRPCLECPPGSCPPGSS